MQALHFVKGVTVTEKENRFAKAVFNRRSKSRAELDAFEASLIERERALEKREADTEWKVEAACEAIIAMVKDSKRGKVVPWAKFSQAALALEDTDKFRRRVPREIIDMLKSERVLDLEERKETPKAKPENR